MRIHELAVRIATASAAMALSGCDAPPPAPGREIAPHVLVVGRITDARITESSGVVASRRHPGVLWTHNDGGGKSREVVYAIDRTGATLAAVAIVGAHMHDFEDIAIDDAGHLYLGDVGDNEHHRNELRVVEIDEPEPEQGARIVAASRQWRLRVPGAPFDCESLFVWRDHGYLLTKEARHARARLFRFALADAGALQTLELVATTRITAPVTGAGISPDGARLAVVAHDGAWVWRIDGDPARIARIAPVHASCARTRIEGCTFVSDGLLATSESREILLFTDPAFRPR